METDRSGDQPAGEVTPSELFDPAAWGKHARGVGLASPQTDL